MRLFSSLITGKESLAAHSTALATVSDNLSNINTVGYKSNRAEFADLITDGVGGMFSPKLDPGDGVFTSDISMSLAQGTFEFTDRGTDAAIDGQGFFVLRDGDQDYFTRAGNFTLDTLGNLTAVSGETVMGYTPESPDTLVPLSVHDVETAAVPSASVLIDGNLNLDTAIAAPLANPPDFPTLTASSGFIIPADVVDSLGAEHTVSFNFFHTDALTWEVQAYVDGAEVGGEAEVPTLLGTAQINLGNDGKQADGAGTTLEVNPQWSNGANPNAINIDMSLINGFSSPSVVDALTVDGNRSGRTIGFEIREDGSIQAAFDNGDTATLGTIALAKFENPYALDRRGSNVFAANQLSGEALIGRPLVDGRGGVQGNALESSNVDQAAEFVNVIRFQRGYQAGSKVISTSSDLIESTINIA